MTTPARKPASRVRAAASAAPASAGAATAPRKTTRLVVPARASKGAAPGASLPTAFRTVVIESVTPELDGGRYPVKREVGETLVVEADLFKEGHGILGARVVYR